MRVLELELRAFGPFSDTLLDFSDESKGLHVVYGLNESGKSSALRALRALLFGIPERTSDDFLHKGSNLLIRGWLRHSDGSELAFLRRKGRKNTVLSPQGEPLDDEVLHRFLSGVGEDIFSRVFGIDHDELVRGGQDILRGGGDVGQALFAAGLGGADLGRILDGLEAEADLLYRPRGRQQAINRAIAEFTEARKAIADASVSGREWAERQRALKRAHSDLAAVTERLRRLSAEKSRLERLQQVMPRVAKRTHLLGELDELRAVVVLPEDFATRRREAVTRLETAREAEKRALDDLQPLREQKEALHVPRPLLEERETIEDLHQRLGSRRQAIQDSPGLEASRQQLLSDAALLLGELPGALTVDEAKQRRPDAAQRVRVREFGSQYQALVKGVERAGQDLRRAEDDLRAAQTELEGLEKERDPGKLKRVLERARRQGDLEGLLRQGESALRTEEHQASIELKGLGLWEGPLERAEELPLPSLDSVDRFEREIGECQARLSGLAERVQAKREDLAGVGSRLEELRLQGEVPTEQALAEARDRRDEGWRLVRRAWLDGEDISAEALEYDPLSELPEAYEKSVAAADEMADRLRREAARVADNASLVAQKARLEQEFQALQSEEAEAHSQMEQVQQQWQTLWGPAGVVPLPPREMRSWLDQHGRLAQRMGRVREHRRRVEETRGQIEEHRSALIRCLEELGGKRAAADEGLEAIVDRCEAVMESIELTRSRRKELERYSEKLRAGVQEKARALKESKERLDQWRRDWGAAVGPLGLTERSSPDEANAVLDRFEEFFSKLHDAGELEVRLRSIERHAAEFAADVRGVLERLAPDLMDTPPEQAATLLNSRLTKAVRDAATLEQLEKQVLQREEELREAQETIEAMTARLDALCEQAGCSAHEKLEAAEARSNERRALQQELETVTADLVEIGGGATLGQLLEEAARVDADLLPGRIDETSAELDHLQQERDRLQRVVWEGQQALQAMDGSARAAEEAEKAQEALAVIRSNVDRYVRLRMASVILRREIERYRRENQGQLLGRAAELFSLLTLGSFSRLETDYGDKDEPILLGVRPSDERVDVHGMSDGTVDQLYLSLRLANLEKYLETGEPMPFVVDDIMIRFDDRRAEATLKVLAELAGKTQVIFFTHHSRLVELAQRAVADGGVAVHELAQ